MEKIEEKAKTSFNQNITPPPAYQCLGTQPLPSAPLLHQQTSQYHDKIQPYEIPQPTTNQKPLIPTVKQMGIQNPPPIDFEQLKITATKLHNCSYSLDVISNGDQPHTNEVTYYDTHPPDTYEV